MNISKTEVTALLAFDLAEVDMIDGQIERLNTLMTGLQDNAKWTALMDNKYELVKRKRELRARMARLVVANK